MKQKNFSKISILATIRLFPNLMISEQRLKLATRGLILITLAWVMFVTMMRALRNPNDFAEAHWLIDYRFGFIKRGLVGSMLGGFSQTGILAISETTITVLSAITFILFSLALLAISWRILQISDWRLDTTLVLLAFASSPFIVMSAHLMGYLDQIFILLSMGAAYMVVRGQSWLASFLLVVAVLVHESVLLVGIPLVFLAIYLKRLAEIDSKQYLRTILPLVLPIAVFVLIVLSENYLVEQDKLQTLLTENLSKYDFIEYRRNVLVPRWLTRNLVQSLHWEGPKLISRLTDPELLIAVLPSTLTILVYLFWKYRPKFVSFETLLVTVVTLSPLLLHAVAFDTSRIWTYIILCAFGCLWLFSEARPQISKRAPAWLWLLGSATILLNIFVRFPLMDYQVERYTAATRLIIYSPLLLGTAALALLTNWKDHLTRVT